MERFKSFTHSAGELKNALMAVERAHGVISKEYDALPSDERKRLSAIYNSLDRYLSDARVEILGFASCVLKARAAEIANDNLNEVKS